MLKLYMYENQIDFCLLRKKVKIRYSYGLNQ